MKILILVLSLATSLAQAEVYTESGKIWYSQCYESGVAPQDVRTNVQNEAKTDACETAKQICLTKHSALYPKEVFHCEPEALTVILDGSNFNSLGDGMSCESSTAGMAASQYSCTVEVFRD